MFYWRVSLPIPTDQLNLLAQNRRPNPPVALLYITYYFMVVINHFSGILCTGATFCPYRLDQHAISSSSIVRPILYTTYHSLDCPKYMGISFRPPAYQSDAIILLEREEEGTADVVILLEHLQNYSSRYAYGYASHIHINNKAALDDLTLRVQRFRKKYFTKMRNKVK